jgi:nickel transport protein
MDAIKVVRIVISLAICCFAAMLWTPPACSAHGMDGSVVRVDGYCVAVAYDDGEPMSYAAVEIKAPNADLVFQTGRTDRNGRFLFQPDAPGPWQAVVQDNMGHRLALDVEVGGDPHATGKVSAGASEVSAAPYLLLKILAGMALIFGLCGFIYGWRARLQCGSAQARG